MQKTWLYKFNHYEQRHCYSLITGKQMKHEAHHQLANENTATAVKEDLNEIRDMLGVLNCYLSLADFVVAHRNLLVNMGFSRHLIGSVNP